MLFNSYTYILVFFPLVALIYFSLSRARLTLAAKAALVIASLVFYGWWNPAYVPLLVCSILFNYAVGAVLAKSFGRAKGASQKAVLILGLAGNIACLGYFKYANFLIEIVRGALGVNLPALPIVLPLGISFFTFTQIAYLVDAYLGQTREYDFLNYLLFVTFFPHLLAGPILHHAEMMPQFDRLKNKIFQKSNLTLGLALFFIGLFKKTALADMFAGYANIGFAHPERLSFVEAWVASLSFSLQLYFDFSGYTDMALGCARILGIRMPVNFNSPYKSLNIQDFWRRWHITLSRFLRNYVYIPLGGNRSGEARTLANLFLTFVIGGIWHGAGYTFLAWGALHGAAMVVHRLWIRLHIKLPRALAWFLTFGFVNLAWVFFRARDFTTAAGMLRAMAGLERPFTLPNYWFSDLGHLRETGWQFGYFWEHGEVYWHPIVLMAIFLLWTIFGRNSNVFIEKFKPNWMTALVLAAMTAYGLLCVMQTSEFLYFQF
jgi:D-alanyl-lipoteichoic acid acyltransferase DltB (MBOAT superfamily)